MNTFLKTFVASIAGLLALGASAAFAEHSRSYKPDLCEVDHDHRSHASNYYDYYKKDRYYRADPHYRNRSGVSFSVRIGNGYDDRYDRRGRYDRRDRRDRYDRGDYGRRNGYRGRDGRIVNKEVFDTRYRARIVLIEEVVRGGRHGPRLICTVKARGPEARYVSERRMHRIANRYCSQRARIRVYA